MAEACWRKKQKLKWFQGTRKSHLDCNFKTHVRKRTPKTTRVGLCNIKNSHNMGSAKTDIKALHILFTCVIHLLSDVV